MEFFDNEEDIQKALKASLSELLSDEQEQIRLATTESLRESGQHINTMFSSSAYTFSFPSFQELGNLEKSEDEVMELDNEHVGVDFNKPEVASHSQKRVVENLYDDKDRRPSPDEFADGITFPQFVLPANFNDNMTNSFSRDKPFRSQVRHSEKKPFIIPEGAEIIEILDSPAITPAPTPRLQERPRKISVLSDHNAYMMQQGSHVLPELPNNSENRELPRKTSFTTKTSPLLKENNPNYLEMRNNLSKPGYLPDQFQPFRDHSTENTYLNNIEDMEVFQEVYAEGIKTQANEKYKAGNYLDAVQLYTDAIGIDPNNPTYYTNRAAALMMMKKTKIALDDCKTALLLDPSSTKALIRAAKCNYLLGNLSEAFRLLSNVLSMEPNNSLATSELRQVQNVHAYVQQAETFLENDQPALAVTYIDRASTNLEEIPLKWKVLKAEGLIGLKDLGEAGRIANEILRADPQNPDAHVVRAQILYQEGDNTKTLAHCTEALRCDPDHTKARNLLRKAKNLEQQKNLGNESFKKGEYDLAYELYTSALNIDPRNNSTNSKLYSNRSAVLLKLGKHSEAILDMDKALELDPTFIKVLRRRADAHLKMESYEKAVQDLKAALDLDRDNREIRNALNNAELELKKSQRKDFYKILGLTKDASEADIKKAYRKLALLHHPDKNAGDTVAEMKFKEIGEAYAVLGDPVKKQRYDSGADLDGISGASDFGSVDPNLFFQMFMSDQRMEREMDDMGMGRRFIIMGDLFIK
ncbi:hypothetical protein G9A89_001514 [Geosiphon pyriformis]|nr:hypothetical protein G9A89_001514 [Geosiphon pyriformis]